VLRYLRLYRTILRTFGFRLRPLGTFGLLQLHRLLNATTRGMDHLLYPAIRRQPIQRPVFILGNPRGGTTFLHRFLLHTGDLCAFQLWEMLLPAVCARRLLGSVVDHLAPLSPARYHSTEAHETSLRDVETDDAMAFFHFVDYGFLWAYFLAWEDRFGSETSRRHLDVTHDPARQERYFRYLEGCWRRNMVAHGVGRVAVKSSMLTPNAADLAARYPDCKILYLVRDPVEAIPSGMSLLTGVLEQSYDVFTSTDGRARARYLENLYQASCHLYRSFYELQQGALDSARYMVVPYPSLTRDFEATTREVVDFAELSVADDFWDRVRAQAAEQRSRKSAHRYSLEKFGLDADRIREDLGFVYEAYDLE